MSLSFFFFVLKLRFIPYYLLLKATQMVQFVETFQINRNTRLLDLDLYLTNVYYRMLEILNILIEMKYNIIKYIKPI